MIILHNIIKIGQDKRKSKGRKPKWLFALYDYGLKNRPMTYDDEVVRQLIDCVVVESKDRIKVIFRGGLQAEQRLRQESMDFQLEMGQIPVII